MEIRDYEDNLLKNVIKSIENHNGKEILSSIIITGSFGRKEPTYIYDKSGNFKLKSDVEVALIYKNALCKKKANKLIKIVSTEFEEDLNLMSISENRIKKAYNFNYSVIVPKYKTLFTFDLYNGSYTIWGKDFLKDNKVNLKEVDLYEAKRIVANRIGELIYLQNLDSNNECLRKQWKGKLLLALGTAWLICEKKYTSSYRSQLNSLRDNRANLEKCYGEDFLNEYTCTFDFLRNSGNEYEVNDLKLREFVAKFDNYFCEYNCNKPNVNNFARYFKYLFRYLKINRKFDRKCFENQILDNLIKKYSKNQDDIKDTATIWHRVIY